MYKMKMYPFFKKEKKKRKVHLYPTCLVSVYVKEAMFIILIGL